MGKVVVMTRLNHIFPLAAVVGQEAVRKALLVALTNPRAGGLLISGRRGTAKSVMVRACKALLAPRRLVEVPLNVSEDNLFGTIDLEYALAQGERRFAPGLLARADGNALYVDEANLLRQELLVTILDVQECGENRVERDGVSMTHAAHYTVLATMNPEEGVLPPHVLDRFGLFVQTEEIADPAERVRVVQAVLAFEKDPVAFADRFAAETAQLREQLCAAQQLLPQVELSEAMLLLAAQLANQANCAGHRAELYILEAARALAALAGRNYLLPQDVTEAATLALPHRARPDTVPPEEPEEAPEEPEGQDEEPPQEPPESDADNQEDGAQNPNEDAENEPPPEGGEAPDKQDEQQPPEELPPSMERPPGEAAEKVDGIDKSFHMPSLALDWGRDKLQRRGSGKRSLTRTDAKQGRYVRAELPVDKVTDLAFDATLRAAAPYQRMRPRGVCALTVRPSDLRQKVREKRVGSTFLFCVDASGSMGVRERMRAVKGAVFHMLQEAYQKRDRVGLIAFRRDQAEVLLPLTRSVDLAQKRLQALPTGGKTPLAEGLDTALTTLAAEKRRDPELQAVLVLVTDGRANASRGERKPVDYALKIAGQLQKLKIATVVIDTETGYIRLGLAKKLAQAMGAQYFPLQKLSQENLIRIIRNTEA